MNKLTLEAYYQFERLYLNKCNELEEVMPDPVEWYDRNIDGYAHCLSIYVINPATDYINELITQGGFSSDEFWDKYNSGIGF